MTNQKANPKLTIERAQHHPPTESAYRARFTTTVKNVWDTMCRQMAFNLNRGAKLVTK